MYESFFGLQEEPFNLTADPRFVYLSQSHGKALEQLTRGVQEKKGLMVLTGQVGVGKTILVNTFLEQVGTSVKTAFVFYLRLDVPGFLQYILNEFGLQPNSTTPTQDLVQLEQFLIDQRTKGNTAVLIVDEAQHLSPEHVRLLNDLEVGGEKLLQILLVGQDELQSELQLPCWRQLRQRIGICCEILPLSLAETQAYIEHRFTIAGGDARAVFHPQVFQIIHRYSIGIPRMIHNLCNHVLIEAYAAGMQRVTPDMIRQIVRERDTPCSSPASAHSSLQVAKIVPHPDPMSSRSGEAHVRDENIRDDAAPRTSPVLWKGLTVLVCLAVMGMTYYTLEGADTLPLLVSHVQMSSQRVYQVIKVRAQHLMADLSEPEASPGGRPEQPKPVSAQPHGKVTTVAAGNQGRDSITNADTQAKRLEQNTLQTLAKYEPVGLEASTAPAEAEKRLFPVIITGTGRDSVARHAREIYGFVNPQLLQLIMVYNTHIADINNLQTGDVLVFPSPDDLLE